MTITAEKTALLTLEQFREILTPTEGLGYRSLDLSGTGAVHEFVLPPGWNIGLSDKDDLDLTEAKLLIGGEEELTLSKEAALGIAHAVGLPPGYVTRTPGVLIAAHLNYWAKYSPDLSLKLLVKGNEALTVMKQSITPFSNIELLDAAVEALCDTLDCEDADIRVDPKSYHDLHVTNMRLVFDHSETRWEMGEDSWVGGLQIRNSLVGKHPLSVHGYMHREGDANAAIMHHGAARYNRKIQGQDVNEVMTWIKEAVKNAAEDLDHEAGVIYGLKEESIADSVGPVLADVSKVYKIPLKVRNAVVENLTESEDLTYYGLVNAITKTANDTTLPEHYVTTILEIGGAVAGDVSHRCNSCKRVIV